jgi:hypothetical protein
MLCSPRVRHQFMSLQMAVGRKLLRVTVKPPTKRALQLELQECSWGPYANGVGWGHCFATLVLCTVCARDETRQRGSTARGCTPLQLGRVVPDEAHRWCCCFWLTDGSATNCGTGGNLQQLLGSGFPELLQHEFSWIEFGSVRNGGFWVTLSQLSQIFFVITFYLQSVPIHSANCVKDVYIGM